MSKTLPDLTQMTVSDIVKMNQQPHLFSNVRRQLLASFVADILMMGVRRKLPDDATAEDEEHQRKSIVHQTKIVGILVDNTHDVDGVSAMSIWEKAFTHDSYDSKDGSNFEYYEFVGDQFLDAAFVMFIRQVFPTVMDEGSLTRLKGKYLATQFQAMISTELQLVKMMRFGKSVTIKQRKKIYNTPKARVDIMEALFGALVVISDKFLGAGHGYIQCFNLLVNLFDGRVTESSVDKDPHSILNERFGIIGNKLMPKMRTSKGRRVVGGGDVITYRVMGPSGNLWATYVGTGEDPKEEKHKVWKLALQYADNKTQFTEAYASKKRGERDKDNPIFNELDAVALEKIKGLSSTLEARGLSPIATYDISPSGKSQGGTNTWTAKLRLITVDGSVYDANVKDGHGNTNINAKIDVLKNLLKLL
jgi:dsRNA-specific ribonuclease